MANLEEGQFEDVSSSHERDIVIHDKLVKLRRDLKETERLRKAGVAKRGRARGAAGYADGE